MTQRRKKQSAKRGALPKRPDLTGTQPPNTFDFDDFRLFLDAWYKYKKKQRKSFSYKLFAQQAGFASPNFIYLVIKGRRNLTDSSLAKVLRALNLPAKQSDYFRDLVSFNQAKDVESKELAFRRLLTAKEANKITKLDQHRLRFFTTWYHSAIRELITLSDFKLDASWIRKKLVGNLDRSSVVTSIELLKQLKLIDDKNGKLIQTEQSITSGSNVKSFFMYSFHSEMLRMARAALFEEKAQNRDISNITMAIPKESLPLLKKEIASFRERIVAIINADKRDRDAVYELNIQLFPVTQESDAEDVS